MRMVRKGEGKMNKVGGDKRIKVTMKRKEKWKMNKVEEKTIRVRKVSKK